jgi:hypothetical protein
VKQRCCDVLVIGGGVSGVSAAVSAARNGAETMLVERESYLGGTGVAGMFQYICGLYLNTQVCPQETLNAGITREIVACLKAAVPENKIKKIGRVYVLSYSHHVLQAVLTALCESAPLLTVSRETVVTAVQADAGMIGTAVVENADGKCNVMPKVVIDCTGDGNAAAAAGAEFDLSPPEKRQLAGFILRLTGLRNITETLSIKVPYHCAQAVQKGILSSSLRFTTFSAGEAADDGYCKMSIDADEYAVEGKVKAEAEVLVRYLATALPEFTHARIQATSNKVLEREGRRILGEYILTDEDVLSGRKFSDGVVKNAWPIELWDRSKGTLYKYLPNGDYYEIPFRCLMVKGVKNLLTAGRCISATRTALGSTRVMGPCMALGDQAGRAAAHYARNGHYPVNHDLPNEVRS